LQTALSKIIVCGLIIFINNKIKKKSMVINGKNNISYNAMIKSKNLNSFFEEPTPEEKEEEIE
jgi:hypothetical protein